jgi:hypothetical protein
MSIAKRMSSVLQYIASLLTAAVGVLLGHAPSMYLIVLSVLDSGMMAGMLKMQKRIVRMLPSTGSATMLRAIEG